MILDSLVSHSHPSHQAYHGARLLYHLADDSGTVEYVLNRQSMQWQNPPITTLSDQLRTYLLKQPLMGLRLRLKLRLTPLGTLSDFDFLSVRHCFLPSVPLQPLRYSLKRARSHRRKHKMSRTKRFTTIHE